MTGSEIYREACAKCHADDSCGLDQDIRIETNDNDCAVCHMPKQPTDVIHASLHQHRIGIYAESYPPDVRSERKPSDFESQSPKPALNEKPHNLYPLLPLVVSAEQPIDTMLLNRRSALAVYNAIFNGALGPTWGDDLTWARNRLFEQLKNNPRDRSVRATLAREYLNHGRVDQAERLLKDLISDASIADRPGIQSISMLSEIRLLERNSVRAKPLFQKLTTMRRLSGDHYLYGLCCVNTGDPTEAIRSFREALRIDPELVAAHQQLAAIHASMGELELANSHQQAVRRAQEATRK